MAVESKIVLSAAIPSNETYYEIFEQVFHFGHVTLDREGILLHYCYRSDCDQNGHRPDGNA